MHCYVLNLLSAQAPRLVQGQQFGAQDDSSCLLELDCAPIPAPRTLETGCMITHHDRIKKMEYEPCIAYLRVHPKHACESLVSNIKFGPLSEVVE